MPEPTRPDADIHFCRNPRCAIPVTAHQVLAFAVSWPDVIRLDGRPAGISRIARFVSNPAAVRTAIREHTGIRLELAHHRPRRSPVVIRLVINRPGFTGATVVAIPTICAIKPDFENVPILGQELTQLVAIVGQVFWPAVVFVVAVPWRKIHAKCDFVAAAGIRELADHVALAVFPWALLNGMLGELARPEAEAIVVLCG